MDFPGGSVVKNLPCQYRRCQRPGLNPRIGKIPWRRKWQPTPVFLPGESHGQRNLAGYRTCSGKESDTMSTNELSQAQDLLCISLYGWSTSDGLISLPFPYLSLITIHLSFSVSLLDILVILHLKCNLLNIIQV